MIKVPAFAFLFAVCFAIVASAERSPIPTLGNLSNVCPEQPAEPEWMQNIEVRGSYKRLLVQQIYRAESMQRIVDAQNCECSTRYPSWNFSERVFAGRYVAADYWDVVAATSEYRRRANELRREAIPICEAAGNW